MATIRGTFSMSGVSNLTQMGSGQSAARHAQREVRLLEANLAKTMMICEALWELLQEKTDLSLDDLHNKLYEIDMRDGELDGRNQQKIRVCPECGRKCSGKKTACLYCGQILDNSIFSIS